MPNLRIDGSFYPLGSDGRTDYEHKVSLQELLTLNTLAPVTLNPKYGDSPRPPPDTVLGHWTSASPYLGKEMSGRYYVTRVNFPEPGKWKELANPVGLFFDSTSEDRPFLTLYDFRPLDTTPRKDRARGLLLNRRDELKETWVDWYPYFG